jgi:hypothetical protein
MVTKQCPGKPGSLPVEARPGQAYTPGPGLYGLLRPLFVIQLSGYCGHRTGFQKEFGNFLTAFRASFLLDEESSVDRGIGNSY